MATFEKHLRQLIDAKRTPDERNRALDAWLSFQAGPSSSDVICKDEDNDIDDEAPLRSVLDEYTFAAQGGSTGIISESRLDILLSDDTLQSTLPAIRVILTSGAPPERASAELAELVGYDRLELVEMMISKRTESVRRIDALLAGPVGYASSSAPTQSQNTASGKRKGKRGGSRSRPDTPPLDLRLLDPEEAQRRIEETLLRNAARPLFTGTAHHTEQEVLPNVFTSSTAQGNLISHLGTKFLLPVDTQRFQHEEYEEVIVPPAKEVPPRLSERLIPVSELDDLCKGSFPGYSSLNRIQSIVYPTAYGSNENMLICAPTGAGKTDVAMLSVLHVLNDYRERDPSIPFAGQIRRDKFKIIYVAPMKALASEIVRKLGKRLKWLNIKVRELTGDMQMTRAEIAETQIIVTTPEKWDVVTRKPSGEGELATRVKLLIIDEVHLLNDERGAVIETIVARTLRQVESTQSMIRIVGLSATLPNFVDVATFLRVPLKTGLFYFDASFRPVPLEQHFIGIRGKVNTQQARKNLDYATYEKVKSLVGQGHQVMVFVHARRETVKTALALRDAARDDGLLDEYRSLEGESQFGFARELGQTRNREMRELVQDGFGIHHAGMLRSDRNLMERLFEARLVKVLCCTATLAWGVNLPAHAVVIKGTQIYDSAQGKFVDISVLDVLQIFGRAGRPGYEASGEGYILTPIDTLDHYLDAVTAQHPIESKFIEGMADSLNAEIALGTVTNVGEGVQWIGYTYLFVRLQKNPRSHGITYEELLDDPQLGAKRHLLVRSKALELVAARMVNYDQESGALVSTDLGRIAAKYYIRAKSIVIFIERMRSKMSEADAFDLVCRSTEFDQIQLRENEIKELQGFVENKDIVPCEIKDALKSSQGKVNILLQAYISRVGPEDFALVSDMAYVAQNAGRIIRALLEIAISRKWAGATAVLMSLSKAVERRIWPFEHPLVQFQDKLRREVLLNITRWADEYEINDLKQMTAAEIGVLTHLNPNHGAAILRITREFPALDLSYELRPLTSDLLRVSVHAERAFNWGPNRKDGTEAFWIWAEDVYGEDILQLAHVSFRQTTEKVDVEFVLSLNGARASEGFVLRYMSDNCLGSEDELRVDLKTLVRPQTFESFTSALPVPFLDLGFFKDEKLQYTFGTQMQNLNALQTQAAWGVMSTCENSLFCAPTGAGKSTLMRMLVAKQILKARASSWALVLLPKRGFVVEFGTVLRPILQQLDIRLDIVLDAKHFSPSDRKVVRIMTPRVLLDVLSQSNWKQLLESLRLVICEDLELLDAEYELATSLLLHATQTRPVRFVGTAACLSDPAGLTSWLRVPPGALSCFRPGDREQDLRTDIQVAAQSHASTPLKALAKPVHATIPIVSNEQVVVFVPTRNQCMPIANDLMTQCAVEGLVQGYLPTGVEAAAITARTGRLQERGLVDLLARGIGVVYNSLSTSDRSLVLELFAENLIRVLIAPRDHVWSLPIRTGVIVAIMPNQTRHQRSDVVKREHSDFTLAELAHMQGRAARPFGAGHFVVFCAADARESLARFLSEGLPLESELNTSSTLQHWLRARWSSKALNSADKQATLDILSWTYLARRMEDNPAYYDSQPGELAGSLSRLVDQLHEGNEGDTAG